jgi:hypothetical protein
MAVRWISPAAKSRETTGEADGSARELRGAGGGAREPNGGGGVVPGGEQEVGFVARTALEEQNVGGIPGIFITHRVSRGRAGCRLLIYNVILCCYK